MKRQFCLLLPVLLASTMLLGAADTADARPDEEVRQWVTTVGEAAGTDLKARDEAIAEALRKAVEEACGVFLDAQSQTENYKLVYDRIFADTSGYVVEYDVLEVAANEALDRTEARCRVLVSTEDFRENWENIRHIIQREDNPRIIVAVVESISNTASGAADYEVNENGTVMGKLEDYLLEKGITVVDRETARGINKRDVLLAALKDDENEVAALGARFKADVVIMGRAAAQFGKTLDVADVQMHQFTAVLNVRVIQTDSGRVLASKSFGPETANSLQLAGGGEKALAKLTEESAPTLLKSVVEAWRQRQQVSRTVQLSISGMDFGMWKAFKEQVRPLRGVQSLRLKEITEDVALIEVAYKYTTENLADNLTDLDEPELEVKEISATRIKMEVVK